jgi:5-methyltetrahydropteroyltriglutamate--homocysteine methyltransferase
MRRSTDRILTTHVGSLPRPASVLDLMKSGEQGHGLDSAVTQAVDAAVREQVSHGADVVTDGEQGRASFLGYVAERLTGFEPRPGARAELWSAEVRAFRAAAS